MELFGYLMILGVILVLVAVGVGIFAGVSSSRQTSSHPTVGGTRQRFTPNFS